MNKNEFLKKLSRLLHMLKEEEVQDILSEYEQHIDMKVVQGQSEEEAIAAFGTVEELAIEILDAYHVKPDFKEKKKIEVIEKVQSESKKAMKTAGNVSLGFWSRLSNGIKRFVSTCKTGIIKAASTCKRWCMTPVLFLKNGFTKKKDKTGKFSDKTAKEKKEWKIGRSLGKLFAALFRFIKKVCYGCIFLLFGGMGIFLILMLGLLIVLMALGYPVVGITITMLGTAMAINAIAYYAGSKWRRI